MTEALSAQKEPNAEATRSASSPHDDLETDVLTIRVFREDDGRFAAEYRRDENREAGMGGYSVTPIGALAELIATLIKVDEDNAMERIAAASPQQFITCRHCGVVEPCGVHNAAEFWALNGFAGLPEKHQPSNLPSGDSERLRAGLEDVSSAAQAATHDQSGGA